MNRFLEGDHLVLFLDSVNDDPPVNRVTFVILKAGQDGQAVLVVGRGEFNACLSRIQPDAGQCRYDRYKYNSLQSVFFLRSTMNACTISCETATSPVPDRSPLVPARLCVNSGAQRVSRHQNAHQQSNDGNNDQQFDQGKCSVHGLHPLAAHRAAGTRSLAPLTFPRRFATWLSWQGPSGSVHSAFRYPLPWEATARRRQAPVQ